MSARVILSGCVVLSLACGAGTLEFGDEGFDPEFGPGEAQSEEAFPGRSGALRIGVAVMEGAAHSIQYEEIDGERVFEGDILLDDGLMLVEGDASEELGARQGALAAVANSRLWPNGVIHYTIDPRLPNQARVADAIAHWHANTPIRLVKRTNQAAYVTFQPGSGCSATVGRTGKQQFINLATSCSTGSVIHEIGHAVGLWHEQARADRDANVTVHWDNITSGRAHNFHTYVERRQSGQDVGAYDLGSIMHYGSYAFSRNGRATLTRKNGATISGQRNGLSAGDIAGVKRLYGTGSSSTSAFIVDSNNSNNNTARYYNKVSSNWVSTTGTPGYYGTGYWYATTAAVSDAAEFYFYLDAAGTRTIDAWWTAGSNRSSATPFIAFNASGTRLGAVNMDQRYNGGRWNTVGSFRFTRGWNKVVVSRWTTGGVVIADAIRVR